MTERLSSTLASGESEAWAPSGIFTVQIAATAGSNVVVELHGRQDTAAPWAIVEAVRPAHELPMIHCVKLVQVKLVWQGNTAGAALKAWSEA